MNTQAGPDPEEVQARSWLSQLLRGFVTRLIVDIMVEFYSRSKADPEFQKRLAGAFTALDGATTQEQNDAAALAIQQAIES